MGRGDWGDQGEGDWGDPGNIEGKEVAEVGRERFRGAGEGDGGIRGRLGVNKGEGMGGSRGDWRGTWRREGAGGEWGEPGGRGLEGYSGKLG